MAAPDRAAARPRRERTENADRRRSQIIEATFRSIVKNGLSGTTLATVSDEAGLSQGVAVFYFKNKLGLLGAALTSQYEIYQRQWQEALKAAGTEPVARIAALVCTDFEPQVCNNESLVIWHAFWGEASARPLFAEISEDYENRRADAMRADCAALLRAENRPVDEADDIAAGIDALTDGLWLRLYLSSGALDLQQPLRLAAASLAAAFPKHGAAFRATMGLGG